MPTGAETRGQGNQLGGNHCLRTCSTTQRAIALSIMVDVVLRMKAMKSILLELGLANDDAVMELHIDSAAAESFIPRRGLGKVGQVELGDLWIPQEVGEGKVSVVKNDGKALATDVGKKFLSAVELAEKLAVLHIDLQFDSCGCKQQMWLSCAADVELRPMRELVGQ